MRFDMEAREVYSKIANDVKTLIADVGLDLYDIDEIVYAGGTGCLPGLDETVLGIGFDEEAVITPFSAGTAVGWWFLGSYHDFGKGCRHSGKALVRDRLAIRHLLPAFGAEAKVTKVRVNK
jgi:heat shock protein 1/8